MSKIRFEQYIQHLRNRISEDLREHFESVPASVVDAALSSIHVDGRKAGIVSLTILEDRVTAVRYDVKSALSSSLSAVSATALLDAPVLAATAVLTAVLELSDMATPLHPLYAHILLCINRDGDSAQLASVHDCVNGRLGTPVTQDSFTARLAELRSLQLITGDDIALHLNEALLVRYRTPPTIREWNATPRK